MAKLTREDHVFLSAFFSLKAKRREVGREDDRLGMWLQRRERPVGLFLIRKTSGFWPFY